MASTSEPRVVPELANKYDDLLNRNAQNYNSVLSAYGSGQKNLTDSLPGIYGGYGGLTSDVDAGYDRSYNAAAKDINAANNLSFGRGQQALISSGLGGSTMLANLGRRTAEDASRSYERLGASIGQARAQDRQRIGLAGLAARMQGLGMQTGLQQNMGGTLAGFHFNNAFGNILGQYSRSDAGGGYGGGGGVSGSAMGGPMGGVSGLEGMLGGMGGGMGGANYGGGGGLGLTGNMVPGGGNYWTGGLNGGMFGGGMPNWYTQLAGEAGTPGDPRFNAGTTEGAGVGTGEGGPLGDYFDY